MTPTSTIKVTEIARKIALSSLLGILVLCIPIFVFADQKNLLEVLTYFSGRSLLLVFALCLCNYLFRFIKWHYYLRQISGRLPYRESLLIFFSGLALTPTPARAGELFKCYLLNLYNRTPISSSAPVVVAEWITDSLAALLLAAMGMRAFASGERTLEAVAVFLLIFLLAFQSRPLASRLLGLLVKIRPIRRFSAQISFLYQSAAQLFSIKNVMAATAISLASWTCEVLALGYILQSLQVELSFVNTAFIFCFASIVGSISMIPGGIAVVEGGMIGLLLLAQVPKNQALLATIVIRAGTLWLGVILGLSALFVFVKWYLIDDDRAENHPEETEEEDNA